MILLVYFLQKAVFNSVEPTDSQKLRACVEGIHQNCWYICSKNYLHNQRASQSVLTDDDAYKLWRVFNFLCEMDDSDSNEEEAVMVPVVMHMEEVAMLVETFLRQIQRDFDRETYRELTGEEERLSFTQVLQLFEEKYCEGLDIDTVRMVMADLYEEFIEQVIKKVSTQNSVFYVTIVFELSDTQRQSVGFVG